jgi:hypothetical protein
MLDVVKADTFANTRITSPLLSANPVSDLVAVYVDECAKSVQSLTAWMTDEDFSSSERPEKSAFMYTLRDEKMREEDTLFDWLSLHVCITISNRRNLV